MRIPCYILVLGKLFKNTVFYVYTLNPIPVVASCQAQSAPGSPWTWECEAGLCVKTEAGEGSPQASLARCLLTCTPDTLLWPLPRKYEIGDNYKISLLLIT